MPIVASRFAATNVISCPIGVRARECVSPAMIVVAAPTIAFANEAVRRLDLLGRFGGRDTHVGESHRGQCACRAPGDGLRVRTCGDSAARHSTVATTTGEHARKLREGPRNPAGNVRTPCETQSKSHSLLLHEASHMAAQGSATPVHGRPTRGMAMAKRMEGGPAMHTVSEAQELLVCCFDWDATAAKHDVPPRGQSGATKNGTFGISRARPSRLIRIG